MLTNQRRCAKPNVSWTSRQLTKQCENSFETQKPRLQWWVTISIVANMAMRVLIPPQGTRQVTQILLNTAQNQSQTNLSLVRLSSTSSSQHASCEDQLRRKMLEKIIRVDHAGEMGASFIYQGNSATYSWICTFILPLSGQMAVLKNTKSRDLIQEMWDHEKAHLAKFEELLVEYQVSFKNSKTTLSLKWKCQISSCSRRYDQQCWSQFGNLLGSPWGRVALCWEKRGQWPAQLRWVPIYFLN